MLGAAGYRRIVTALRGGVAAAAAVGFAITFAAAADLGAPIYKVPDYGIVGWGGWIFNPSVIVGAVYDDNIYRSQTNRIHSWGTEVIPSFAAELNEGIYRTSIYGTADARLYSENNSGADTLNASAGIRHIYEAQRDLIFRFSGDFVRQTDPFNAGVVASNGVPIVSNNNVNNFSGTASVEKDFNRVLVVLGETVNQTNYDDSSQRGRDGTIYTTTGRVGLLI